MGGSASKDGAKAPTTPRGEKPQATGSAAPEGEPLIGLSARADVSCFTPTFYYSRAYIHISQPVRDEGGTRCFQPAY